MSFFASEPDDDDFSFDDGSSLLAAGAGAVVDAAAEVDAVRRELGACFSDRLDGTLLVVDELAGDLVLRLSSVIFCASCKIRPVDDRVCKGGTGLLLPEEGVAVVVVVVVLLASVLWYLRWERSTVNGMERRSRGTEVESRLVLLLVCSLNERILCCADAGDNRSGCEVVAMFVCTLLLLLDTVRAGAWRRDELWARAARLLQDALPAGEEEAARSILPWAAY